MFRPSDAVRYLRKNPVVSIVGLADSDLAAVGGVGTFVLAAVAVWQMKHSRRQTEALEAQVATIRETAESELALMRDNVRAAVEQGNAVREAARAQVQPIVFAFFGGTAVRGPDEDAGVGAGEVGIRYSLANEGTGVALNVAHGVEICGIERAFGDGMTYRSLIPGEIIPPPGSPKELNPCVAFNEADLPANWPAASCTYWVRFENVFGDRFETRNPHDPSQSASFIRVTDLGPLPAP
jgi:hypothetical protein